MTVRSGMESLITKLRHMGQAGDEDYTVVEEVYWSDDHIQDILDNSRKRVTGVALSVEPEYVSGTYEYKRYVLPYSAKAIGVEGTAGGTASFRVYESDGDTVTGYTFKPTDLSVTFTSDTDGTAYYFSGYAYDLNSAARELWLMKAGHAYSAVDFSADGHSFSRSKLYDHCMQMVKFYDLQSGGAGSGVTVGTTRMTRPDTYGPGEGKHF